MSAVLAMVLPHDSLRQVRALLTAWVAYRKRWRPDNGLPSAVCWIDEVKGSFDGWTEGDDYDSRIYATEMRHVDQAIRDLPSEYQHAIAVCYLNEIGPRVWRSARKTAIEIRQLCNAAELRLIPALRRRDVVV